MDLKINKIRPAPIKADFFVAKKILFPYGEIGKSTSKKQKGPTGRQTVLDTLERIADLDPETIRKTEKKLRLTFVPLKEESGNVCMANSPEVRDEYKDTFNAENLWDYMYAVLYSSRYLEKYKDLSKFDVVEVPHPNHQNRFWKLTILGAQLRQLHLLESLTAKIYIDETNEITKKIDEIEIEDNL